MKLSTFAHPVLVFGLLLTFAACRGSSTHCCAGHLCPYDSAGNRRPDFRASANRRPDCHGPASGDRNSCPATSNTFPYGCSSRHSDSGPGRPVGNCISGPGIQPCS